jgi:type I restriction enzyme S subunit
MEVRPGYKQTEVGLIPQDWDIKYLDALGTVVRGGSPRPAGDRRYFDGDFIPWLTVAALTNIPEHQLTVNETVGFLTEAGSKLSRTLEQGTLIIANSGATLGVAKLMGVTCCANDGIAAIVNQRLGDKPFICSYINSRTKHLREVVATGNGQPNLNTSLIRSILIPFPPEPEQRAIATALSDVDALLGGLDRLISKKRDLKKATMQLLLTGQTRLPGFQGEWEVKRLGDVAHIKTGSRNNEDKVEDGKYSFFVRSETVERINSYSHDCEAILVPGEGRIGDIFHYINGRFDVHQRVYAITQFKPPMSPRFVHLYMALRFGAWAMQNTVKATVDSLRLPTFQNFEMRVPPTKEEQSAIAEVLSDMDAELAALEVRRNKTRDLKQAMMQELLTGKTRLVPTGAGHA